MDPSWGLCDELSSGTWACWTITFHVPNFALLLFSSLKGRGASFAALPGGAAGCPAPLPSLDDFIAIALTKSGGQVRARRCVRNSAGEESVAKVGDGQRVAHRSSNTRIKTAADPNNAVSRTITNRGGLCLFSPIPCDLHFLYLTPRRIRRNL